MGYFEMNYDIAIAFVNKVSYNFAIFTHVIIFINYKYSLNFINNEIKFVTKHKRSYVSCHLLISPN